MCRKSGNLYLNYILNLKPPSFYTRKRNFTGIFATVYTQKYSQDLDQVPINYIINTIIMSPLQKSLQSISLKQVVNTNKALLYLRKTRRSNYSLFPCWTTCSRCQPGQAHTEYEYYVWLARKQWIESKGNGILDIPPLDI